MPRSLQAIHNNSVSRGKVVCTELNSGNQDIYHIIAMPRGMGEQGVKSARIAQQQETNTEWLEIGSHAVNK